MLFQLLSQYIEYKLYTSIEEVHEKIVVHYAVGDLTDGEFNTLFNLLFPLEVQYTEQDEIEQDEHFNDEAMTLDIPVEEDEELVHVMPKKALEILHEMAKADILQNKDHKLNIYKETGQLTEEQFNSFTVVEDVPTILPEFVE